MNMEEVRLVVEIVLAPFAMFGVIMAIKIFMGKGL